MTEMESAIVYMYEAVAFHQDKTNIQAVLHTLVMESYIVATDMIKKNLNTENVDFV